MGLPGKEYLIPCWWCNAVSKRLASLERKSGPLSMSCAAQQAVSIQHLHCCRAKGKRKHWNLQFSLSRSPFSPLPGCASLAQALVNTHLLAQIGILSACKCSGTSAGVFSPRLSCVLWSMTWEIRIYEWKYRNHYKNSVLFFIFMDMLQA